MTNNILDIKKHSTVLARLVTTAHMQEHGVECYFSNAATAINFSHSRSEILSALKKDISKTAEDLFKGQPIIYSIKAGHVTEFDSMYNTVDDVFGLAFDKDTNTITLSGVAFDLTNKFEYTKAQLAETIYRNIFSIDAKELSATVKAITRYEDATLDIDKAVLSPSLSKADEMIKKIANFEIKYSSYRSGMDYEQQTAFDSTFKRTGIDGVIQNSTYIDASGIKQFASSHKQADAKELEFAITAGSFKYIDAIEVDSDGDLAKVLRAIRQIERLKINTDVKFTLKFRKLGNLNATGVCFAGHRMIAEDVRDTSAVLHEIAHHIHLITLKDNKFVNYMISKLSSMINLTNVKEEQKEWVLSKSVYFHTETEIVARALEIASLFAQEQGKMISGDDEFMMVKNRRHYEELEGIYFNFTQFDETTQAEFSALFELFFNTSPNDIIESSYDNFIKKDTQYRRVDKELSMTDLIKREAQKAEAAKRALYAMVSAENIQTIIDNRGTVSISELATTIMTNISHCGDHNARMTATDWAIAIESKAGVVYSLVEALQLILSKKEVISYFVEMKSNAWESVQRMVFLTGFSGDKFRMSLRKELKERESDAYFNISAFKKLVMEMHPISLADKEVLEDKEYVKSLINSYPDTAHYIDASLISIDLLREYVMCAFGDKPSAFKMNKALADDKETIDYLITNSEIGYLSAGEGYKNNPEYMKNALDNLGAPFHMLGKELNDDEEFVSPYVKADNTLFTQISSRLQKEPRILALFDNEQREIDSIEGAPIKHRYSLARKTTYVEVLKVLAKDKNMDVRLDVARRDICPADVLEKLSTLKCEYIRKAVAAHPNTPKSVLTQLIASDDSIVLQGAAISINLNSQSALKISKSDNRPVVNYLIYNPNILEMNYSVKTHRDIVRNCLDNNEEYFFYKFKTDHDFNLSFKFMSDMINNIDLYVMDNGYVNAFVTLLTDMMNHQFGVQWGEKGIVATDEAKKETTQQTDALEDFELLVGADEIVEVIKTETQDFDALIEQGEIVEFERTDGKGTEQVLRIDTPIDDFKSFNQYLKTTKKGYYSRVAKGFILYTEFANELRGKLSQGTQVAASIAATLYTADMLQAFASGTLF